MPTLDVFKTDAFSLQSLTAAILKAPFKPGRLGQLGIFAERGITTTSVVVEEKDGQLSLIANTPRGAPAERPVGRKARTARSFAVPHLTRESAVYADEIQNVRAFGTESDVEAVQTIVDERLMTLRMMHEVTLEFHRIGALKGTILDADGSTTIFNLFTEFGVTQQTQAMALTTDDTDVRGKCVAVARQVESELGASVYSGLRGLCSASFFDSLVDHPNVKEAFRYQQGQMLGRDLRYAGFSFGGITWEEYRGSVNKADESGTVAFITAGDAYVFPEGAMTVDGPLFRTIFAPADFLETVNTVGLPLYVKNAPDPEGLNRFVKLHSQSNPLCLCLRPRAVVKCTRV